MGRQNQSRRISKRTTMKTLLFVAAFLAMALAAPQPLSLIPGSYYDYYDYDHSNCVCSEITLLDSRTGLQAGNCINPAPNGRYYCYVSVNSDCPDMKQSQRSAGLYFSYLACDLRSPYIVAPRVKGENNANEGNED